MVYPETFGGVPQEPVLPEEQTPEEATEIINRVLETAPPVEKSPDATVLDRSDAPPHKIACKEEVERARDSVANPHGFTELT